MRHVVVSDSVLFALESLLPIGRGGDRPSRDDFIRLILFPASDYFAEHWDGGKLLPSERHPTVRTLIATHELVPLYEISGRELPDGTIEL